MATALHLYDQMSLAAKSEISHNLTDAIALVLVWNNGPIPIQLFARTIGMSHPAAVQQIDRLCADGLLERAVGKDRRYRPVRLTQKGRNRVRAFLKARSAIAREVFTRFSRQDRATLERLICRILSACAIDRSTVDHLCRCCDEQACPPQLCPAERPVAHIPSPLFIAR
jgi:DNA-binding MarR family transcriptional regulator